MSELTSKQIAKIRKRLVIEQVGQECYHLKLHSYPHKIMVGPAHATSQSAEYIKDLAAAAIVNIIQEL